MTDKEIHEQMDQQLLEAAVEKIRVSTPTLAAVIERCRLIPSDTPEWRLLFKDAFSLERAQTRQKAIEATFSEVAGRPIHFVFEVGIKKGASQKGNVVEDPPWVVPEHMVPINVVYEVTKSRWNLQKRAVQWYATQGLIPKPEHYGRDAYFDKQVVFDYFELIHLLTRTWDLSLRNVRQLFQHAEALDVVETPNGQSQAIPALLAFLNDFTEYEQRSHELYGHEDEHTGETVLSGDAWKRLKGVKDAITRNLCGTQEDLRTMLSKRVLDLEENIGKNQGGLEEIPF